MAEVQVERALTATLAVAHAVRRGAAVTQQGAWVEGFVEHWWRRLQPVVVVPIKTVYCNRVGYRTSTLSQSSKE